MKFVSTRAKAPALEFSEAMAAGLAPDGGLYVPERFPRFEISDFKNSMDWVSVAERILKPFIDDHFQKFVPEICKNAFDFSLPLITLDSTTSLLELFHGATAAFKDMGARFLAECVQSFGRQDRHTVLVATSGDTGAAVAGAFFNRPNIEVVILYPKDRVSPFQEKQLTAWGGNVRAFAVSGTFDDCQRIAKEAFLDEKFRDAKNLMGANSINIGRILPQSIYYAWASLTHFKNTARQPGFVVPSGNLGNSVAALWAKKMGFPIAKVVLACNANKAVPDFFETGRWNPKPTIKTIANAMDVGNASNMERLRHLYPDLKSLREDAAALSVGDSEIREGIKEAKAKWGKIVCPHTAAAVFARRNLKDGDWIIVATAHAAKFKTIVEPVIHEAVPTPASLAKFEKAEGHAIPIDATLSALKKAIATY